MAMWDPYITSVQEHLEEGDGKIVFDKFHIAGHLGQAVDRVRRREHKELRQQGDLRLVGSKYDWLRHPARFSQQAWREFRALRDSNLKTARAWALKETLMRLFDYRYQGAARSFFRRWFYWATHSRLRPVIRGGPDAPTTTREHPDLPAAPDHERDDRISEREDSSG